MLQEVSIAIKGAPLIRQTPELAFRANITGPLAVIIAKCPEHSSQFASGLSSDPRLTFVAIAT
jgi:hypothetical protein